MSLSPSPSSTRVVLCWHMHQPQYRNLSTGQYKLPWTYLHGIKDYVDMATLLKRNGRAKAVFNFSPVLLEQLLDYCEQIKVFFSHNVGLRDPLLASLISPTLPTDDEHAMALVKQCMKANDKHMIGRFPAYRELIDFARLVRTNIHSLQYTNSQFLADLVTWYHLAWLAETTRQDDTRVIALMEKGRGFTMHERLLMLRIVHEQLERIIPMFRELVSAGQVELSMSPNTHPIFPLLLDFQNALQSMPNAPLPNAQRYPGGVERCHWHLEQGAALFERSFGKRPVGIWPSEGAISDDTIRLISDAGFQWLASGQQVLMNSVQRANPPDADCVHRPYVLQGSAIRCFFRDDRLSDLIGFTYKDWHGDDAVNNLVVEIERIADQPGCCEQKVLAIILDGENCWEYYPNNGLYFLTALYERLATNPKIQMSTFSDCLAADLTPSKLPHVVAGSWVYGTLSTWIGDADKNRAWDALVKAKKAFDAHINDPNLDALQRQHATEQLAICEGSDWFWWFGDYNPAESVSDFEILFREHLANLYRFLGLEIPEELTSTMSQGSGKDVENAGVMRRSQQ